MPTTYTVHGTDQNGNPMTEKLTIPDHEPRMRHVMTSATTTIHASVECDDDGEFVRYEAHDFTADSIELTAGDCHECATADPKDPRYLGPDDRLHLHR